VFNKEAFAKEVADRISAPSKPDWPQPMAQEAFYGVAGDYVRLLAPESESDDVALLGGFLVAAGVLFGRNAWARVEDTVHYPVEALLLCGPTSGGRKGTSTNRILPVMASVQADFAARTLGGLSTGEGLIAAVKQQRMFGYEGTNVNFLVFLPEFSSLLAVMTRTGNTLSAVIRQAWDGQMLEVRTRKDPLEVDGVNISFLCHVTREELLSELTATSRANGFGNRFLVPLVRRSKLLPEGGAKINTNPIIKRLTDAVATAKGRGEMRRNDPARELWASMYAELARARIGLAGSMAARAEAHCLRLSLIYALLDGSDSIQPAHLKAAGAFWNYCEESLSFIFGDAAGDIETDKILGALLSGPMSLDDFHYLYNRNKPADWIRAKLAELVRLRMIVVTVKPTEKGNVTAWMRVNE
jgi:hypothetical protein